MNIFYLDHNPVLAARYHCNKHVVKMIVETAQILSTTHRLCGGSKDVYRSTHKNHPSVIWAREGKDNYRWLYALFKALSDEYTDRYGRVHLSWEKLSETLSEAPSDIPDGTTPLKLVMPEEYKQSCPVKSYRAYYRAEKAKIANWTKQPEWW